MFYNVEWLPSILPYIAVHKETNKGGWPVTLAVYYPSRSAIGFTHGYRVPSRPY